MENLFTREYTKSDIEKPFVFNKSIAAGSAIAAGSLSILTGLMICLISCFDTTNFHGLETILPVSGIGLLILGVHFLDLIEREKRHKRIVCYQKYGLTIKRCGKDELIH